MGVAVEKRVGSLLGRLRVFAGSFDLVAFHAVCGVAPRSVLEELVASGGLFAVAGSDPQRWTLPTAGGGNPHALDEAHALHFASVARDASSQLDGPDQARWLDTLELDLPNLRAAIRWALGGDGDPWLGMQIAVSCFPLWYKRRHVAEGLDWTRKCLAGCPSLPTPLRLDALNAAGALLAASGDFVGGRALLREALHLVWTLADRRAEASILTNLGTTFRDEGDLDEARKAFATAVGILREQPDPVRLAHSLSRLAPILIDQEAWDDAEELLMEADDIYALLEDPWSQAMVAVHRSELACRTLEGRSARRHLRAALETFAAMRDLRGVGICFNLMSRLEAIAGRPAVGAMLCGAADGAREFTFGDIAPIDLEPMLSNVLALRATLGDNAFDDAWTEGRDLPWEEAVELALEPLGVPRLNGCPA